jgi:acetyl esterase/lipase
MRKLLVIMLFMSAFYSCLHTQTQDTIKLWPENSGSESKMYVYYPEIENTALPAVLICPGGGYNGLAIYHEGHDMAKWYASQGFVAAVLKYRMPKGDHTIPLIDAEKAISIIRENAKDWHVDKNKVGVIGSSAGGHLAASLSNLAADENRPNFAILYYPVISFDNDITHHGTKNNLLGDSIDNPELVYRYSLEKQVNDQTPQTLLLLSDDDDLVVPANSIRYYSALKEKKIPAAMYIFPTGGHGWGFKDSFLYQEETKTLIQKWLKETKIQ